MLKNLILKSARPEKNKSLILSRHLCRGVVNINNYFGTAVAVQFCERFI